MIIYLHKIQIILIFLLISILNSGCVSKRVTNYDLIIKKEDVNMINDYKTNIKTGETYRSVSILPQ